jgi:hypothetical protein
MKPTNFEQAVFDRWGHACVVCGRTPEEWLATDAGTRVQDKLSLHHVNGDDTDDRVENVIPLCQSCHVHIHRVDEPPYRKWHRQLPIEHRHAWNAHYQEYYEGPRLTREEAERRFGDDEGVPESVKYLEHERENFDPAEFDTGAATDGDAGVDTGASDDDAEMSSQSNETDDRNGDSTVLDGDYHDDDDDAEADMDDEDDADGGDGD